MPEGPEVKRMADQLKTWVGWNFHVSNFGGRYKDTLPDGYENFQEDSHNVTVIDVGAKGKFLYWKLSNNWSVWVTLGMSGTWERNPKKHEAMQLRMSRLEGDALVNSYVSFVDARHFGTVRFVYGHDALNAKLSTMMWDLLEGHASTTAVWWFLQLDKHKSLREKQVSVALMNQNIFPGIGNYLRAEILYASKVSPLRPLKDVTYDELKEILKNGREIMLRSYESGGATIATYRDAEGNKGTAQARFACYGRKRDPLGNPVVREKTSDGRTIHWVKEIQK